MDRWCFCFRLSGGYLSPALLDSFTLHCSALREDRPELFSHVADFDICHLFISAGHNYFGRHEKPPGEHAIIEVERIQCVTAKGIAGDRFFDFKKQYKGQITFFEEEVYQDLCLRFGYGIAVPKFFAGTLLRAVPG